MIRTIAATVSRAGRRIWGPGPVSFTGGGEHFHGSFDTPAEALPGVLLGAQITLTNEAGQPLGDVRVVTISVTDAGARRVYWVGDRTPQESE